MTIQRTTSLLSMIFAGSFLLVGCGGGGGDTATSADSPMVAQGVIQGFGSICINGVRYGVDGNTQFDLDDSGSGGQDDMTIGMVATIQGQITDDSVSGTCPTGGSTYTAIGVANTVGYDDEIQGQVTALNTAAGTFSIAGITVQTDANTLFRDLTDVGAAGLDINDMNNLEFVEVSGFPGDGIILATYVEGKGIVDADTQEFEVKGTLSALNTGTETFSLTLAAGVTLPVDYSGGTVSGTLSDGALVEVKGNLPAGILIATRVELEDSLDDLFGIDDNSEVEGMITHLVTDGGLPATPLQFDIGRVTVDIANATILGGELLDLVEGIRVEVEGFYDGSMIVATKIKFHEGSVKLVGLWNAGQVMGVTIVEDAFTVVKDDNGSTITTATLTDGDYVEVKGFETAAGDVRAKRIEVEESFGSVNASNKTLLQGKVDAFDLGADTITILGITIDTAALDGVANPSSDFEGLNDNDLSRSAFYGQLAIGTLVKARGGNLAAYAGGILTADQVELED